MKKILFFILALFFTITSFAQTSLFGEITETSGETVIFGNVVLYQNGVLITETETDFDGNYHIDNLEPGIYDVEVFYLGFETHKVNNIVVVAKKPNKLNIVMSDEFELIGCPHYFIYKIPLMEQDNTTSGATMYNIRRGAANMSFTTGF